MATDYISTTPWDSAENPWPIYGKAVISASNIPSATVSLERFNPIAGDHSPLAAYNDNVATYLTFYGAENPDVPAQGEGWYAGTSAGGYKEYFLATSSRQIPVKTAGAAGNWIATDGGGNPANLVITPITSDLTQWTKRRLWNLNG